MARQVLTARLSPTGMTKIDELAKRTGRSRSEVARVLLGLAVRDKDVLTAALTVLTREEGF